jgi:hypothetical protein
MERATLPRAALGWVLRSANRAVPVDTIAPGRMLLTHLLAVHAVDGHGAGLYRWSGSALESRTSGEEASTCELSAFLCLGGRSRPQCLHRLRVRRPRRGARRARSRGYRAAHVKAGIVHGRLLLCGHALANGATGLTFFDEAVRGAFETTASWLLVTAVALPLADPGPAAGPATQSSSPATTPS